MEALARWAGYLAIVGGAIAVVVIAITAYDPNSGSWYGFFLVVALLGAALPGLRVRTKVATGQLGRASAWLSAIGALALLIAFGYAAAASQATSGSADPASDPLAPVWLVSAVAWFIGNIGFAVALLRARVLSSIGAWLVLAGAVVGLVVSAVLGENLPPAVMLLFGLFGIGWIVIGYAAVRPTARAGMQGQELSRPGTGPGVA